MNPKPSGAEAHFRAVAPAYMRRLLSDFPALDGQGAAAIFGNLGHESLGFTKLQEMKPTVKGSRGGWGWAQWTGPRRRAFEAYCARTGKDPASDEANYAYLFVELKGIEGTEAGAIARVVSATGLQAKVEAFEKAFLRAGVKHYESRLQWARIAVDALREADEAVAPIPRPAPSEPDPSDAIAPLPDEKPGRFKWWIIGGIAVAAVALFVAFVPIV